MRPPDRIRSPSTRLRWLALDGSAAAAHSPGSSCVAGVECGASQAHTTAQRACGSRSRLPGGASDRSSRRRSVDDAVQGLRSALVMQRYGPAVAGSAASSRSYPPSPGTAARSGLAFASTAPARDAPERSPFFSKCLPRHFVLEHRLRQQLLQLRVLRLERFEALGVRHIHPAELAAPEVIARLGEAVLAAQLLHRDTSIAFAQEPDDLFFAESLLHVQPPAGVRL